MLDFFLNWLQERGVRRIQSTSKHEVLPYHYAIFICFCVKVVCFIYLQKYLFIPLFQLLKQTNMKQIETKWNLNLTPPPQTLNMFMLASTADLNNQSIFCLYFSSKLQFSLIFKPQEHGSLHPSLENKKFEVGIQLDPFAKTGLPLISK